MPTSTPTPEVSEHSQANIDACGAAIYGSRVLLGAKDEGAPLGYFIGEQNVMLPLVIIVDSGAANATGPISSDMEPLARLTAEAKKGGYLQPADYQAAVASAKATVAACGAAGVTQDEMVNSAVAQGKKLGG